MELSHEAGTYKVYSDGDNAVVRESGRVVKNFTGETAWSDAERWVDDNYNPHLNGPSMLRRLA